MHAVGSFAIERGRRKDVLPRKAKVIGIDVTKERLRVLELLGWRRQLKQRKESLRGRLLLGWVVRKGDTLFDVAFQAFYTGLEEDFLVLIEVCEWVQGFLSATGLFECQYIA